MDATIETLRELAETISLIDSKYMLARPSDKLEMKDERDSAFSAYTLLRTKMLRQTILITDEHLKQFRDLRRRIEEAGDMATLIRSILKFSVFVLDLVI